MLPIWQSLGLIAIPLAGGCIGKLIVVVVERLSWKRLDSQSKRQSAN
jgi:hypothetical protein